MASFTPRKAENVFTCQFSMKMIHLDENSMLLGKMSCFNKSLEPEPEPEPELESIKSPSPLLLALPSPHESVTTVEMQDVSAVSSESSMSCCKKPEVEEPPPSPPAEVETVKSESIEIPSVIEKEESIHEEEVVEEKTITPEPEPEIVVEKELPPLRLEQMLNLFKSTESGDSELDDLISQAYVINEELKKIEDKMNMPRERKGRPPWDNRWPWS